MLLFRGSRFEVRGQSYQVYKSALNLSPQRYIIANGILNARPGADASIPPECIFGTHDSLLNLLSGSSF